MRRRRGYTLAELVVAMFIAAFVSTMVYAMFTSSLNTSQVLQGEEDVMTRVNVIYGHFSSEVEETDLARATLVGTVPGGFPPDPGRQTTLCALAFPTARDLTTGEFVTDPDRGTPVWQALRIYYLQAGSTDLRALTVPLSRLGGATLPLPPDRVRDLCQGGEVVAWDATSVNFAIEPVEVVNYPVVGGSTGPSPTPSPSPWQPTSQVPGRLHLYLTLAFHDRQGRLSAYPYEAGFLAANSFYADFPPIYPSPTTTPSPPAQAPQVPKDWSD
ncbi:MAG TPA: prepilin-type N-terminal cleavage/methylation domain-containing protein [Candidatus Nitrosotenuis sp.]|nr:prepilin-type N-terminal cleavage/methylation domain-containing protein [Candidatus Nitrosotenuis sp.]